MAIDLLAIQPNIVSRDLSGYVTYIFGEPKVGKTTMASQMKNALVLATEPGFKTIPGIRAQEILTWGQFKQVLSQLKKPEVKAAYKSIVVDTVDILIDLCEKSILDEHGVEKLTDIQWGEGTKALKKEVESALRSIAQMGYALFMISHATIRPFTRLDGTTYDQIMPTVTTKLNTVICGMADIYGYAHKVSDADGNGNIVLTIRANDDSIHCGSRFKYIDSEVPFTYDALAKAVTDAIDREAKETKGQFVTDEPIKYAEPESYDFQELMNEFNDLVASLKEKTGKEFNSIWGAKIREVVARYLGKGRKVADCTEDQAEQLSMIISDLRDQM